MSSQALNLQVLFRGVDRLTGPLRQVTANVKRTRDELRQLEQTQRQLSGYRNLQNQLTGTGTALDQARQRARALQQELVATERPTKALRAAYTAATREVRSLTTAKQSQTQRLTALRQQLQASGLSTSNLAGQERRLADNISQVNARLRTQQAELDRLTSKQQRLQQLREQHGRDMMRVGMVAGAGYGAVAAGRRGLGRMGSLVTPGMDFEAAMSGVQALARLDRDSPELAMLRRQAREYGASTQFTSTDVASGQSFLAMAGFTPAAIRDAIPGLLDMAAAGRMDLGEAADIASNIAGAFGILPDEMGRVADVLTYGFTTANTDLAKLGQTMKYVGSVAREAGLDLETTTAMAGLLGNIGIQADQAGTQLREMLNRLSGNSTAIRTLAGLGIDALDSSGNLRVVEVLGEVGQALEGLGGGERLSMLQDIFGVRAGAGMAELVNREGIGALTAYAAQFRDIEGTANRVARTQLDNLRGDLTSLGSAWASVGESIFSAVGPALRALTQWLTGLVRAIGTWLEEHPRLTKWLFLTIGAVLALVTVLGVLMITYAAIAGPFKIALFLFRLSALRGGMLARVLLLLRGGLILAGKALLWLGRALMMNPIGLLITAIAAAAWLIYRYWEPIKGFFSSVWQAIVGGAGRLIDWFASLPERFREFGADIIRGLLAGLTSMLPGVGLVMSAAARMMPESIKERLGIQSPSRVFAGIGRDTMAGLAQGLEHHGDVPISRLRALTQRIRNAGRGIMLGLAAGAASAAAAADTSTGAGTATSGGNHYEIHIHAAPGMDEDALARLMLDKIREHERMKAQRQRSALFDRD